MYKKLFFALSLSFLCSFALAQLPKSNIYMFDMAQATDSTYEFSNPRYLTLFNQYGYNNHPSFFKYVTNFLSQKVC